MVAHVSPSTNQKEESRNTLIYADRTKNISHKVERNVLDVSYHVSQYQTVGTFLAFSLCQYFTDFNRYNIFIKIYL